MAYGSTFHTARRLGAGGCLTDGSTVFEVSDFSPSLGQAYGWPILVVNDVEGVDPYERRGAYQMLPDGLRQQTLADRFVSGATRIAYPEWSERGGRVVSWYSDGRSWIRHESEADDAATCRAVSVAAARAGVPSDATAA